MGAQHAGLQKNDVLVGMAGKPITNDFNSLPNAIEGKKGGDVIEVVFYRGAEKMTVNMELSKRPMPDVPRSSVASIWLSPATASAFARPRWACTIT